jgi:transposase-like protein
MSTCIRTKTSDVSFYSDEFKWKVVHKHLMYGTPKYQFKTKYGIKGKSKILKWMRKFEASNKVSMSKSNGFSKPSIEEESPEVSKLRTEGVRLSMRRFAVRRKIS